MKKVVNDGGERRWMWACFTVRAEKILAGSGGVKFFGVLRLQAAPSAQDGGNYNLQLQLQRQQQVLRLRRRMTNKKTMAMATTTAKATTTASGGSNPPNSKNQLI
jgi:hypothetical protein